MSSVEEIESGVTALPPAELARFRAWFAENVWAAWDRGLEEDASTGKLDALAAEALREHTAGRTKPL